MASQVNVNTTNNQVTVTQGTTQIVTVSAQGPQGVQGPVGATGPSGSIPNTGSFATTGSNSFIGNQIITGSLIISGSSTFTNIGPAIFSGSLNITEGITGSFSGTATSASFAITASHALFAISASHEVIKEVSSSHANFADSAGGLSGIPSIVINQITASGDISASSATITALTGSFNHIITDDDTIEFRNKNTGVQTGRLKFDPTTGLNVQDNTGARTKIRAGRGEFLSLEAGVVGFNSLGSITASVNISASGDIVGSNLSGTNTGDQDLSDLVTNSSTASFAITGSDVIFGNITSSGNISATGNISASGDLTVNNINVASDIIVADELKLRAGGSVSPGFAILDSVNLDFFQNQLIIGGDASIVEIEIGRRTSSNRKIEIYGQITASGDISASGDIVGNNLSGTNTGDQDLSNLVTNSSTASFAITGSDVIFGNITASGNISASSTIIANGLDIRGSGNATTFNDANITNVGQISLDSLISDGGGDNQIILNTANMDHRINDSGVMTLKEFAVEFFNDGTVGHITASGNISSSGDIIANKVTADVIDTSFETFLNFEAATAFTFIAPFPLTINFTGSSTSSMDVVGFVTASANTSTFSVQQTPPITLNIFDKLKVTPSSSGLFSFSGSRTI
jgi:hypothetical protein